MDIPLVIPTANQQDQQRMFVLVEIAPDQLEEVKARLVSITYETGSSKSLNHQAQGAYSLHF